MNDWEHGWTDENDYDADDHADVDPKLKLIQEDRERRPDPWAPRVGGLRWWRKVLDVLKGVR